jgi:transposase
MVVVDGKGVPLGVHLASASPAEVTLIEETVDSVPPDAEGCEAIERLVYDKAADSDQLRMDLADRGIELICPHRKGRKRPPLQDGRPLRRYRRRWIVERTIAWFGNYRRLLVRHEYYPEMFLAFVHIACALIALSRL